MNEEVKNLVVQYLNAYKTEQVLRHLIKTEDDVDKRVQLITEATNCGKHQASLGQILYNNDVIVNDKGIFVKALDLPIEEDTIKDYEAQLAEQKTENEVSSNNN